ncbi:hypothetical protein QFZ68_007381 [Streptomyces sp. V1I6]|nr:hypothetical protein [Streptomyces sp. V1I6]
MGAAAPEVGFLESQFEVGHEVVSRFAYAVVRRLSPLLIPQLIGLERRSHLDLLLHRRREIAQRGVNVVPKRQARVARRASVRVEPVLEPGQHLGRDAKAVRLPPSRPKLGIGEALVNRLVSPRPTSAASSRLLCTVVRLQPWFLAGTACDRGCGLCLRFDGSVVCAGRACRIDLGLVLRLEPWFLAGPACDRGCRLRLRLDGSLFNAPPRGDHIDGGLRLDLRLGLDQSLGPGLRRSGSQVSYAHRHRCCGRLGGRLINWIGRPTVLSVRLSVDRCGGSGHSSRNRPRRRRRGRNLLGAGASPAQERSVRYVAGAGQQVLDQGSTARLEMSRCSLLTLGARLAGGRLLLRHRLPRLRSAPAAPTSRRVATCG